jgi:hypothetical protein
MAACASSRVARRPHPQAARRRGSPGRRRAGSSVPAGRRTATTSTACERPATRGCRCLAGPGRSPIRPCRTSRPGSAPTRGSRRVIPVAQLADGISQLGMSPPHLGVMQPWAKATARLLGSSIAPGIVRDRKVNLPRRRVGAQDPRSGAGRAWQSLRSLSRPKGGESTVTGRDDRAVADQRLGLPARRSVAGG